MANFIADVVLLQAVADTLKKPLSALQTLPDGTPSYWPGTVSRANTEAAGEITDRLIRRGWTPAQVSAWDRGIEVQTKIGLYFALRDGGALEGFNPEFINALKRFFDPEIRSNVLDNTLLTSGSVWATPKDTPGTVGVGAMDTSGDMFVIDPNDGRIGRTTRW